jgi:hypothetical protein
MRPQILFDPADVKKVLASLPTVAALIPDPFEEGEDSDAFSGVLRKTERELYRWIAHTHYDHLAEVVTILEQVHAAGCTFGNFLTTTSRVQFISHTAELLVAEDLLHRGFSVRTVPLTSEVSPDLHVTGNGIDVAVEVYSPRELEAVDEWVRVVNDLLNFMDVAVNYRSTVETRVERGIPPDSEPNSWMIAEQLQQTHDVVLAEISRDAEDSLRVMRPLDKSYRHPETSLLTKVELTELAPASPLGPDRFGSFSYPGFSGYSPAGVFGKKLKAALRKARRRQTHGVSASARALVVYLMGTKIAEDLLHPAHMGGAEAALNEIEPKDYGLDVIAFVVRALPRGLASILTVMDDETLTIEQVEALFASETRLASTPQRKGSPPPGHSS